jgi:hypothetical protein
LGEKNSAVEDEIGALILPGFRPESEGQFAATLFFYF